MLDIHTLFTVATLILSSASHVHAAPLRYLRPRAVAASHPPVGGPVNLTALLPLGPGQESFTARTLEDFHAKTSPSVFNHQASALVANFQAGSKTGGLDFLSQTLGNVSLLKATHVVFSYTLHFPTGFDFGSGGELPGISKLPLQFYGYSLMDHPVGGDNTTAAKECSTGEKQCFSVRPIWREHGMGELYVVFVFRY